MILSIDPGLTVTAYAFIAGEPFRLLEWGTISPPGKVGSDLWTRCRYIVGELDRVTKPRAAGLRAVAVEFPQTYSTGKRSAATLPNYGVIVGAIAQWAAWYSPPLTPSASEWTRGYPTTKGDPHKARRVAFAAALAGVDPGTFGARSVAGNVADAILLGGWAKSKVNHLTTR